MESKAETEKRFKQAWLSENYGEWDLDLDDSGVVSDIELPDGYAKEEMPNAAIVNAELQQAWEDAQNS